MSVFDKARDYAQKNSDKVAGAIGKVEKTVDERTGRKYTAQIRRAGAKAHEALTKPNPRHGREPGR